MGIRAAVQQGDGCDLATGVCGPLAGESDTTAIAPQAAEAAIRYFTDPICSHCWAMEPAMRRLFFHYGDKLVIRHVYGGLLPSWTGFADRAAGISKPADVAPHWAEVAERYGQPIDPRVWLTDPLSSSFPPSIAAHTVRLIAPATEEHFLRRLKVAVFLEGRNISRIDVLAECAADVGIDADQFVAEFEAGRSQRAFEEDRGSLAMNGVRGFPTLLLSGPAGETRLRGTQVFETLENAVLLTAGLTKAARTPTAAEALASYGSGTLREFAELLQLGESDAEAAITRQGAVRLNEWLWGARTNPEAGRQIASSTLKGDCNVR